MAPRRRVPARRFPERVRSPLLDPRNSAAGGASPAWAQPLVQRRTLARWALLGGRVHMRRDVRKRRSVAKVAALLSNCFAVRGCRHSSTPNRALGQRGHPLRYAHAPLLPPKRHWWRAFACVPRRLCTTLAGPAAFLSRRPWVGPGNRAGSGSESGGRTRSSGSMRRADVGDSCPRRTRLCVVRAWRWIGSWSGQVRGSARPRSSPRWRPHASAHPRRCGGRLGRLPLWVPRSPDCWSRRSCRFPPRRPARTPKGCGACFAALL